MGICVHCGATIDDACWICNPCFDKYEPGREFIYKPQKRAFDYEELGQKIGKVVDEKQAAYGDSFGKSGEVLKILYPKGISPEQYNDALCIVRIIDKLFRIATDKDALGESPYRDIAGYGLLGAAKNDKN